MGAVEVLLLRDKGDGVWECLTKPGRKTHTGTELSFGDDELTATVVGEVDDGNKLVQFHYKGIFLEVLERLGQMPLPPYIHEQLQDPERYQTVYSRANGSAAAPTAGLHFTKELLEKLQAQGVNLAYVTLHVGLGTFRPVKAEEITDHHMHSEFCMMSAETAELLNRTHREGHRIVCVGTTSCRTVESLVEPDGHVPRKVRLDRYFHLSGVQVPRARRIDHELPSAGKYACNARFGACRAGEYPACLSGGSAGKISLFLVRRCDVHPLKSLLGRIVHTRRLHV